MRRLWLSLSSLLGVCAAGGALAQGFHFPKPFFQAAVAVLGETAPGAGGGTFVLFLGVPAINASGDVAFMGIFDGASLGGGLFLASGKTRSAIALTGDTAPGTGGGTYIGGFTSPSINSSGDVAFESSVTGGSADEGIFVVSGGAHSAIALTGQIAPGTGGGTYSGFETSTSINDSGDVAFYADVTGGSTSRGLFVVSGGTHSAMALIGDTAPGTGGGTYSGFYTVPSMNALGDVAFRADVTGGDVSDGIFVVSGGTHSAVALPGGLPPGIGTYYSFPLNSPSINASGEVAFYARITSGASLKKGLFVEFSRSPCCPDAVLTGDQPQGLDVTYSGFDGSPAINAFGDMAFYAGFTGGSAGSGFFVTSYWWHTAAAVFGGAAPGTGGGTYGGFTPFPAINAFGDVAFKADIMGGSVTSGIFAAQRLRSEVAHWLEDDGTGGTQISIRAFDGTTFSRLVGAGEFSGGLIAASFGGFHWDEDKGFALSLEDNGTGGTRIASQRHDGVSSLDSKSFIPFTSTQPPTEFGGFSWDSAAGVAFWLEADGSGGTRVSRQAFDGSSFSGPITSTPFAAATPPTAFGGFSFDAPGQTAYWLADDGGGGTAIHSQTFDGASFSGDVTIAAFDAVHAAASFGGLSVSLPDDDDPPPAIPVPVPSWTAVVIALALGAAGLSRWRKRGAQTSSGLGVRPVFADTPKSADAGRGEHRRDVTPQKVF